MTAVTSKALRRSAKFKADLALRALAGEVRGELAEKAGASTQELNSWVETFVSGGRAAFSNKSSTTSLEQEITRLHAKIGSLVMQLESRAQAANNGDEEGEE